jgi:predicted enzyme related to lactoylglutathione lyase
LRIFVPEQPPQGDAGEGGLAGRPGYRYMSFEVADMKQALEAVEAAGGKLVLGPVEPRPDRQVAQIIDPDGNLIEIGHDG